MKKYLKLTYLRIPVSFVFIILLSLAGYSQKLNALLSYSTFYSPSDGPYIETYLKIDANSLHLKKSGNGTNYGKVQIIMLFKEGDSIVSFDKYEVKSPEFADTSLSSAFFIDLERYSLPNGKYNFEIYLTDLFDTISKPYVTLQPITIDFTKDKINLSGIELVESYKKTDTVSIFSKAGYDIVPNVSNFFPENINKITYYTEIYNTKEILGENEKFLISSYIEVLESGKILKDYIKYKRETSAPVNVVFGEFDITELPSGNYYLTVEIKNKENKTVGIKKSFFQRSNPNIKLTFKEIPSMDVNESFAGKIKDLDTLREYIRYLYPISNMQELSFSEAHLQKADLPTLQKFFYSFWKSRDAVNPEQAWLNYLNQVNMVNNAYSTPNTKGYKTDRGRVYLKYGPPNSISESYNEPAAYPYEIWHYYQLANGQRNKKFVFYSTDIVTNDFQLLHSDVVGELSNYRWQYFLFKRVDSGWDIDRTLLPDGWGESSTDYYNNPR